MYIADRSSTALHDLNKKTRYTITPNRIIYSTFPLLITDKMLCRMIGKTSTIWNGLKIILYETRPYYWGRLKIFWFNKWVL